MTASGATVTTPTQRLLATRAVLEQGRMVTAGQLAAAVGVSVRTARRHVRTLRDMGVPVESASGPEGGYRLARQKPTPNSRAALHLDDDEAVAVAVALALLEGPSDDPESTPQDHWRAAARRAAVVLETALGPNARERVITLRGQLSVTRALARDVPAGHVAFAVATALEKGRAVRLRYVSASGATTDRDVDPHGLVMHGGRWYLAAWDHLRQDRRTFRLDRIVAVLSLARPIAPGHELDAPSQVLEGVTVAPWQHDVELVIDAPRHEVAHHVTPGSAILTAHGDRTVLRIGENHLVHAAQLVARLPWDCTIVRPEELRAVVAQLADRLSCTAQRRHGDG